VTLYDPTMPFYASEMAPPELDNMLAQLLPKLNFTPPLADLLYRNPYKTVRGNIQYGLTAHARCFEGRNQLGYSWLSNRPKRRSANMRQNRPTAEQYRITAAEIRQTALQSQSEEICRELLELAERYERLAAHAERRQHARSKQPHQ
jgi:hypothetical protein